MESKLNHQAIDAYSKAFAKKVTQSFFNEHSHINGQQILSLCEFNQINLIVLKNLFRKWKKENAKLQSPYFNYQNDEVKKAMKAFMNALSKHIHIKKEHFEPLLRESVRDTILLVFSPYDFFSKEINQRDDSRLRLADLHDLSKYIKVNDFLLDGLIRQFEQERIEVAFNDEAFAIFNDVCANTNDEPEDIQQYLATFSKVVPLNSKEVYSEIEEAEKAQINEQFQQKQPSTLGDKLGKQKHKSLKKQLTLNQRFMFVNELFEGNQQKFQQAVEQIDDFDSHDDASQFINKNYIESYDWDLESEEVQEFMELVERKFK
jgi:hypothetical protein